MDRLQLDQRHRRIRFGWLAQFDNEEVLFLVDGRDGRPFAVKQLVRADGIDIRFKHDECGRALSEFAIMMQIIVANFKECHETPAASARD